ncbi:Uncharacterised protein [Pragia fontium]|uniref:YqjK-like family protein n=1 Tax=Pragia fontium TaxID=82985 RepID=UPI000E07C1A4|nr:YqjK-like family protein [Pragia fontium]SUB83665.1 Uncharacterised protein [Pragia fontium]
MNKKSRELKKALLVDKITRQRTELAQQRDAWLEYTADIDRGWLTLFKYRKVAAISVGVVAVVSLRHPKKLMVWGRRAFGIWTTVNLVRQNLSAK